MPVSTVRFTMEHPETRDVDEMTYEVVGVHPDAFMSKVAGADGIFFDFIEERSAECGDLHQSGSQDADGLIWRITSTKVCDIVALVESVVNRMQLLFGWTLLPKG